VKLRKRSVAQNCRNGLLQLHRGLRGRWSFLSAAAAAAATAAATAAAAAATATTATTTTAAVFLLRQW